MKNINMQKSTRILFILLFLLLLIMIFYISRKLIKNNASASSYNEISNNTETLTDIQESKKDITFNLTAIGDIMCHNTQYFDAYNSSTDSYDFSYVFSDISNYIQDSDITVANLETTFAGKDRGYSNYPRFNTPDELAYDIGKLGVDVVSTSGNHSLDYGFYGLSRTIDTLNNANISHVGTYKTQEERDTILFKEVNGVKIAFLNYAYGTNGITIPSDKPYCINIIDKNLIKNGRVSI